MRISLGVLAIFASCALAATTPVCDPNSDACRAVMDGTACFNENNASTGSKNAILACLTGTDGAGTPTQKMCGGACCAAPVSQTWILKNLQCPAATAASVATARMRIRGMSRF